ncbi:MAG: potassium channel protein [Bacteroidota bacterium]
MVRRNNFISKFFYAIVIILLVIALGTLGYILIENYSFIDALYMTVITVGTVGYREVIPLTVQGKIFTIFLIILSLGVLAYSLSLITSYFVEGELRNLYRNYKTKSGVKKMKNHVIICGYGRNGKQAALRLNAHKEPFVVIDNNHEIVVKYGLKNVVFVEGDATLDEILIGAGVQHAKALITTLPIDPDNMYVVLSSRALNSDIKIISRASNESAQQKLIIAGANNVVIPESVGGAHMASLVINPDILHFFNMIFIPGEDSPNLVEFACNNMNHEFQNRTIEELKIRIKTGANIIGLKTSDNKFIINPPPNTRLVNDSKLFVLGTQEQIEYMKLILTS